VRWRDHQLRSSPRKRGPRATERGSWIPSISASTRVFDALCAGMNGMERREFITLLGGAAMAWPLAARAQQMPVVGFLSSGSLGPLVELVAAFRQGLAQVGYVEGHNVAIEYRFAEGRYERLPALAADLAGRRVAVMVSVGGTVVALAAKASTTTIPIVFLIGDDPVKAGLVASFNRPESNITGITQIAAELGAKRVELLHDVLPHLTSVAFLVNPNNPNVEADTKEIEAAGRALGIRVQVMNATGDRGIEAAFLALARAPAKALIVSNDALFTIRRERIVSLAAHDAVPAIYAFREFVAVGGLMSYGPSFVDAYHEVGVYTGRILKGEKTSELPVQQPTKFELVVNLGTAKALGFDLPPTLLARSDEVIE
jgi:putative tryptophan/tyrosine transport system substrate-binding protein